MTQRYSQYVDDVSGVVKAPPGFANNDDCWRSSWFYASLLVIHEKDNVLYHHIAKQHSVDLNQLTTFLRYFRENCVSDEGWKRATTLSRARVTS